uniref:Myosin-2B-like n=1 Tax=Dermatophagoides pteronyssinus TaxID=6956 RepID=A0A6P6XLM2_DERPT|nr:myosin-2B-like [Dermatophagoides pteronyssinus]
MDELYVMDQVIKKLNTIHHNLSKRFIKASNNKNNVSNQSKIYTYAGQILISINPCQTFDNLYRPDLCELYYLDKTYTAAPHPFSIANKAFNLFLTLQISQFILVSGESGSGKTECTKSILQYLTWVTQRKKNDSKLPNNIVDSKVNNYLLLSNPFLEYFGNAKTLRNNNSSRFGKLFTLYYSEDGKSLLTANVDTYLLAKSRVVDLPDNEQNYHVFYSIVNSPKDFIKRYIDDDDWKHWKILGKQECLQYSDLSHPFNISRLLDIFKKFGLNDDIVDPIFRILFGILYLGEIQFMNIDNRNDAKLIDDSPLQKAMELWGIPFHLMQFINCLTTVKIRDVSKKLSCSEAHIMAMSVCKGIYECLFNYLVNIIRLRLNEEFTNTENSNILTIIKQNKFEQRSQNFHTNAKCIGVLDLFGFENVHNSLEQFCINYANEELHRHFLNCVVSKELDLLVEEEIANQAIREPINNYLNSQNFVNKEITKHCAYSIENDCSLPGTPISSTRKKKRHYTVSSNDKNSFIIQHYPEDVIYDCTGFIQKNTDYISSDLHYGNLNLIQSELKKVILSGQLQLFYNNILVEFNNQSDFLAESTLKNFNFLQNSANKTTSSTNTIDNSEDNLNTENIIEPKKDFSLMNNTIEASKSEYEDLFSVNKFHDIETIVMDLLSNKSHYKLADVLKQRAYLALGTKDYKKTAPQIYQNSSFQESNLIYETPVNSLEQFNIFESSEKSQNTLGNNSSLTENEYDLPVNIHKHSSDINNSQVSMKENDKINLNLKTPQKYPKQLQEYVIQTLLIKLKGQA